MQPNIENFIGCDSSYRAASIVLYGAPYDSTTSYRPGARFGPAAIRHESYGLETYSPYQNADLTDFDIFDSGDLELCFGSSESALADIEARTAPSVTRCSPPSSNGNLPSCRISSARASMSARALSLEPKHSSRSPLSKMSKSVRSAFW